jgi:alpha-N-arabinofuranosidase
MSTIKIDTDRVLCRYNPLVLGQFVEHYGKAVYGGICSEDGSTPNDAIVPALRTLSVPVLRWPGGNFASGYHWQDGVGPREDRPVSFDLEWQVEEPNSFGTVEYLDFCERIGCTPYVWSRNTRG